MPKPKIKDAVPKSFSLSRSNAENITKLAKLSERSESAIVDEILTAQFQGGMLGVVSNICKAKVIELNTYTELKNKLEDIHFKETRNAVVQPGKIIEETVKD